MRKFLAAAFTLCFAGAAFAQNGLPGGTVTSIASTCGVSGGTITTTGTLKGSATPNAQVGTSYAFQDGDCGKVVTFTNAAAIAATIAQAGGGGNFVSGWFATLINEGAGTVTLTPATSTVDGAASITLTTNQSVDLFSDGTNYFTARGRGSSVTPGGSSGNLQTNNGSGGFAGMPSMTGDVTLNTGTGASTLKNTGPGATGPIGSATVVPIVTIDAQGRITALTSTTITQPAGANPTATAGPTAVNGVATTYMRSDAAPAVQQGSSSVKGVVQVDNTSVTASAGVIGTAAHTGDCTSSAGSLALKCQPLYPLYIASNWYNGGADRFTSQASSSTTGANVVRCYPGYFYGTATVSTLGGRVNATSGNVQLAVYANAAGRPDGVALMTTGNISATVAGPVSGTVNSATPKQISGVQLVWWCSNADNATVTLSGVGGGNFEMGALMGSATQGNILAGGPATVIGVTFTSTFGTWPNATGKTFTEAATTTMPIVQFLVSSIP
jgi:hypothetical protein